MDGLTAFYEITTAVFAVVACLVAWVSYRYTRGAAGRSANEEQVKRLAREVTATMTDHLAAQLAALEMSAKEIISRVAAVEGTAKTDIRELRETTARIDAQGSAGLGLIVGRVAVLESKMEVFWKNVAFDVSKILHSPHSGWENLDLLLEKFRARNITAAEMADLETQLRDMVEGRWEPASVTRADQVAASLLLRAIEQTRV